MNILSWYCRTLISESKTVPLKALDLIQTKDLIKVSHKFSWFHIIALTNPIVRTSCKAYWITCIIQLGCLFFYYFIKYDLINKCNLPLKDPEFLDLISQHFWMSWLLGLKICSKKKIFRICEAVKQNESYDRHYQILNLSFCCWSTRGFCFAENLINIGLTVPKIETILTSWKQ